MKLLQYIILFFCLCIINISSCALLTKKSKTRKIGVAVTEVVKNTKEIQPPTNTVYVHDTITINGKHLTPEEYQRYLQKFYEDNYIKLISPEFKRLNNSNAKLSAALGFVIDEDNKLRTRARKRVDSLNKKQDSTERDNAYWKAQAIKYEKENAVNLKKSAENSLVN